MFLATALLLALLLLFKRFLANERCMRVRKARLDYINSPSHTQSTTISLPPHQQQIHDISVNMPKTLSMKARANKYFTCRKHFVSDKALKQHTRATNYVGYTCGKCGKTFSNEWAIQQHYRDTLPHDKVPHGVVFECAPCDRLFGDETALKQHQRSRPHAKIVADQTKCGEPEVNEEDTEEEDIKEENIKKKATENSKETKAIRRIGRTSPTRTPQTAETHTPVLTR
jgi:hypothetical protein